MRNNNKKGFTLKKLLYCLGVVVVENCKLLEVVCDGDKVIAIDTTMGSVECDYYVNCGGFWARKIGQRSNPTVKIPLHPVEHYYLLTNPIPNLDPLTPGLYYVLKSY